MKLSVERDEFLNYFLTLKYFLIQKYKIDIRKHKNSTLCYINITANELDEFKDYLNNLNIMLELIRRRNI